MTDSKTTAPKSSGNGEGSLDAPTRHPIAWQDEAYYDLAAIEKACQEAAQGQVVSPANVNSPGQIVIAGHAAAVDRASELCKKAGARRAVRLPVSAPFHCALMMPAQERLQGDLARLSFADPRVPLVNNVDARTVRAAADCRDGLVRQVSAPVRWQPSKP